MFPCPSPVLIHDRARLRCSWASPSTNSDSAGRRPSPFPSPTTEGAPLVVRHSTAAAATKTTSSSIDRAPTLALPRPPAYRVRNKHSLSIATSSSLLHASPHLFRRLASSFLADRDPYRATIMHACDDTTCSSGCDAWAAVLPRSKYDDVVSLFACVLCSLAEVQRNAGFIYITHCAHP